MYHTTNKSSIKKTAIIFAVLVVFVFLSAFLFLLSSPQNASAQFIGPSGQGGTGAGLIGYDASRNLSIGTSTTRTGVKLLIVGSSTAPGDFAIQVINANVGPVLLVTNDGRVSIGSTSFASGTAAGGTFGAQPGSGGLFVHGPIRGDLDVKANGLNVGGDPSIGISGGNAIFLGGISVGTTTLAGTGNILFTGSLNGSISATNITSGVLQGNQAVQQSLGVNTSTQVGLPQEFSVYGDVWSTGTFFGGSGTVSAPTYSWISDPNTGWFSSGADTASFSSGGSLIWTLSPTVVTTTLPIWGPAGGVGSPTYSFTTDANTGIYSGGSGILSFAVDGTNIFTLTSSGGTIVGNTTTTNLTITNLASTGSPCLVISSTGAISTSTCGGAAITSLNGLTAASQTFTTSSGSGFNITSAGSVHTFTVPSIVTDNSVALTSETTGNYVANLTGGNGITVTGSAGEGWTPTATVNTSTIQARVSGTCAAGSSIRVIDEAGTVSCETDDGGGAVAAGSVTTGVFGGITNNANFAFEGNVGFNTSSQVGLPADLSVYGTSYFSGNVGIGVTASEKLDVAGNIRAERAAGASIKLKNLTGGGNAAVQAIASDDSTWAWWGSQIAISNSLFEVTDGASQNKFVVMNTGNVGIGTSTPADELHLASANPSIRLTENAVRTWRLGAGEDETNKLTLRDMTANLVRLTVDSSGNVGIGTSTPGGKLDVWGGALIGTGAGEPLTLRAGGDLAIKDSDGTGTFYGFMDSGVGYFRVDDAGSSDGVVNLDSGTMVVGYSGGNVGIGTATPGADIKLDVIQSGTTGTKYAVAGQTTGAATTNIGAYFGATGATNNYGLIVGAGNVGIGTTTPASDVNLHIYGASPDMRIQRSSAGQDFWQYFTSESNGTLAAIGIRGTANDYLRFFVNGSDRMVIDTSGNVGIGTTGPNALLAIGAASVTPGSAFNGKLNVRAGTLGTTSGNVLKIADFSFDTATNHAGLGISAVRTSAGTDWTTTAVKFQFDVDNTNPVADNILVLDRTGNVGIGTAAPATKLEVIGSVSSTQVCLGGTCNSAWPASGVSSVTAGTGLTGGGTGAVTIDLGTLTGLTAGADTLAVNYGSTANTAAQGNVTLTGPDGGAGLTGGGGAIAVGAGGTFTALAVGAGTGITVNANDVAINTAAALTWTGAITVTAVGTDIIADKIDVGTIDPIYTIGGRRYATYVSGFAGGVREETSDVVMLEC